MSGSLRDLFRVRTGVNEPFALSAVDPGPTAGVSRNKAEKHAASDRKRLARLQDRLSAEGTRSLLFVLQGMDTSGKDGTVKHVIGAMNPGGIRVVSFKAPTEEELQHDFLWRIRRALPAPGQVGVFNRSHYEDVTVVRIEDLAPEDVWRARYKKINVFEKSLAKRGITVVKVFLHISRGEQKSRILKRLEDPTKRWKFNEKDLEHRDRWNEYMEANGEAISRCSTEAAPWYIVPANAKWFRDWAIGRLLIETLEEMNPRYPEPALDVETITARLEARARPSDELEPVAAEPEVYPEAVPAAETEPAMDVAFEIEPEPLADEEAVLIPQRARDILVDAAERPES